MLCSFAITNFQSAEKQYHYLIMYSWNKIQFIISSASPKSLNSDLHVSRPDLSSQSCYRMPIKAPLDFLK